jgi:hypothetical protein
MVYPPEAYLPGFGCSGISVLDTSGQGVFYQGI